MKPSHLLLITILGTGLAYVASFVGLGGGFPNVGSTGEDVVAWFSENGGRARFYAWMGAFVSLGLGLFAAQIASLLPRPHCYMLLAGVLGFAITAQVQAWIWAGLAFRPDGLDPSVAGTLFDIAAFWGPLVNASTVTMAAAFVYPGLPTSLGIPHWLKWLSVAFLLEQAIETITVFGKTGFIAPGGTMNVYLGGVLGFLWIAGVVRWALPRVDAAAHPEKMQT